MKTLYILLIGIVLSLTGAKAQSHEKVVTVFLYNFAINGQWEPKPGQSEFIIGVLDRGTISKELQSLAATKTVGTLKIKIVEFNNASDVSDCHILFIPESKSGALSAVAPKLGSKSTLIVTEKEGLAKKGSGINFITVDGKLRYELNDAELDRRNIKLSGKIKSLGIAI
jgi:hypothetical protein